MSYFTQRLCFVVGTRQTHVLSLFPNTLLLTIVVMFVDPLDLCCHLNEILSLTNRHLVNLALLSLSLLCLLHHYSFLLYEIGYC